MCSELSAIGTKEPHYHLIAFIMKATVWANVLEEGQETEIEGQEKGIVKRIGPDKGGYWKVLSEDMEGYKRKIE